MTPAAPVGTPMHARDALNYYFSGERTSAAVVHCYVFDTVGVPGAVRTDADAVAFAERIVGLDPLFRRRLTPVRGNATFPHWVEVEVEVADHVVVHTPTAVDSRAYLFARIVEFTTVPIGWDLPPWQFHFVLGVTGVDGVPDGATVVIFRSHHSAIDGMGVVELLGRILSDEPAVRIDPDVPVTVPRARDAVRTLPRDLLTLGRATLDWRRAAKAQLRTTAGQSHATQYPATRFNTHAANEMTFDVAHLPLHRVRALKSLFDRVTVNDVMITVVSLALSEYLAEMDMLPADSLGTTIPVSTRTHTSSTNANRIAVATLPLHTNVVDPVERLLAVHASAASAKAATVTAVTQMPPHPLTVAPAPVLASIARTMRTTAANPIKVATNTMITNVPYGSGPLTLGGAPMVGVFGPLPTVRGVYLAHAVSTFGDSMHVSITSLAELMPDTGRYVQHICDAFVRLEAAAAMAVPSSRGEVATPTRTDTASSPVAPSDLRTASAKT